MDVVVTLIADYWQHRLDAAGVETACAVLRDAGGAPHDTAWLSPNEACDLFCTDLDPMAAAERVRTALAPRPIDVIAQPCKGRRKKGLIADMESTLIAEEMLDELGRHAGLEDRIAAITARAMNGEIDFVEAVRERAAMLAGLSVALMEEAWAQVTIDPGAEVLVATMRAHGAHCLLVSGGFTFFTVRLRDRLGFHADQGNRLEILDGKLTGQALDPILDKEAKLSALRDACAKLQCEAADFVAVGDGANDIPMLQAAGLGVAYHAKPTVKAAVPMRLDHCDLTALLFAQGYSRAAFSGAS